MTMYILAGGCDRKYPEYATQLGRVVHAKIARPRILSCGFAQDDERAERKFPQYRDFFTKYFGEYESFVKAEKSQFIEQIREADVVYFHGGRTSLLLDEMQKYPDIQQEFAGKIIIGSSAGANYLSSYCWASMKGEMGLAGGVLNVATVVHYGSTGFEEFTFDQAYWDKAVAKVREVSGRDEIILLPEGIFTVIER